MRRLVCLLLLGLEAGCATRQAPPRTVSGSWSTVQGLAPGTLLAVYITEQRAEYGTLEAVADQTVTLRGRHELQAFSRAEIERLAVRTSTGISRRGPILQTALAGAAITGALALFAKGMEENPRPDARKWAFFLGGTAAAAGIGALRAPRETFTERLVYIRP